MRFQKNPLRFFSSTIVFHVASKEPQQIGIPCLSFCPPLHGNPQKQIKCYHCYPIWLGRSWKKNNNFVSCGGTHVARLRTPPRPASFAFLGSGPAASVARGPGFECCSVAPFCLGLFLVVFFIFFLFVSFVFSWVVFLFFFWGLFFCWLFFLGCFSWGCFFGLLFLGGVFLGYFLLGLFFVGCSFWVVLLGCCLWVVFLACFSWGCFLGLLFLGCFFLFVVLFWLFFGVTFSGG